MRDKTGHYVLEDGTRLMSVTTIIGHGIPKPELASWSAYETARTALDYAARLATITDLKTERAALDWLIAAADRIRDEAAENGSLVHDYIEAFLLGQPLPALTAKAEPYIKAFQHFLNEENPTVLHSEIVVASLRDRWAGKVDVFFQHDDAGLVVGDWKTSRKPRDTAAMQLAAYRRADCAWLADGTRIDPPVADQGLIIHIRPEKYRGGYRIYEADTSEEVYEAFLAATRVARLWTCSDKSRLTPMRG